jgi:hypothetical protein
MPTTIKVQAHQIEQGGRIGYVCAPTIGDMLRIIPERANPDVIQDANRRLYVPHGKSFGDYLLEREDWVCGALMAGITEDSATFNERTHMLTFVADELEASIKLFDGQHRRYGFDYAIRKAHDEIETLVARLETTDDKREVEQEIKAREQWIEQLLSQTVTVILYVEEDIVALQQMFADISKVRAPGTETRVRFDRSDPFNLAAIELAATHPLLKDRVEMERATLGRGSANVLTLAQVVNILRVLQAGINARPGDTKTTPRAIVERGTAFFDDVVKSSEEVRAISRGDASVADVRERGALPLNPTILRIEAGIWRELRIVKEAPSTNVVDFLSRVPSGPAEAGLWVESGVLPSTLEKVTPMGRAQEARKAVALAVEEYERVAA